MRSAEGASSFPAFPRRESWQDEVVRARRTQAHKPPGIANDIIYSLYIILLLIKL